MLYKPDYKWRLSKQTFQRDQYPSRRQSSPLTSNNVLECRRQINNRPKNPVEGQTRYARFLYPVRNCSVIWLHGVWGVIAYVG